MIYFFLEDDFFLVLLAVDFLAAVFFLLGAAFLLAVLAGLREEVDLPASSSELKETKPTNPSTTKTMGQKRSTVAGKMPVVAINANTPAKIRVSGKTNGERNIENSFICKDTYGAGILFPFSFFCL